MYPGNGPDVVVNFAQQKFDANGNLVDQDTRKFLGQLLQNLVNWTEIERGGGTNFLSQFWY